MYKGNAVGVVGCVLALVVSTGCSREQSSPSEATNQVAQAVTSDAAAPVTPTACVVSLGALQIGDSDTIQASIAGTSLQIGATATVTGNAFSSGNVTLGNHSSVSGTLSYTGQLTQGTSDTFGALVHTNVAAPTITRQTFSVGTTDVTVAGGATQTLAAGMYRNVNVGSGAHVTFSAGTTSMASLVVQGGASVTMATSSGAVALRVQGTVNWGSSTVTATDATKVTLYSNGTTFQLASGLTFPGTIEAPSAAISVGSGTAVHGCIAAATLTLPSGASVIGSTNPCAVAPNGTACSDGNACTQTDTCQAGVCTGSNPVVCTASDQCHTVGTCNPNTGVCTNPAATNGTACSDGNACTQTDTCQAGVCTGSNPVVCKASDQCHAVGTCAPSTGVCTNPEVANGTACNDGNACTQSDTCQAGVCTGADPVTCTPSDQCHSAGTCNATTGVCSNPAVANGAACSDGNACTVGDSCQNGACASGAPAMCTASDQCHAAGTCNPSTGVCSNPPATNGTVCNDGNACTQTDTCQAGVCTGANPVTCTASDQCHSAGTCNPATGVCSNPVGANGTACNDGNACTQTDTCQGGVCTGANPVTCTASDQCHTVGTCNASTGACANPPAANGTTCNDGNACTQTDSCLAGVCTGANPVTCTASDQCHSPGTCDPTSGTCSNPAASNGTACSDGNACTQGDTCQAGVCTGGSPVTCTASDQCHSPGTCDPTGGICSNPVSPDGTPCNDGNPQTQNDVCTGGVCSGTASSPCTAIDSCHLAGMPNADGGTCSNPVAPDGTNCGPATVCAAASTCLGGVCQPGTPVAIDDGNPCTLDTCDPDAGIVHHACTTINRSTSTVFPTSTAFLYSGANPVQTGVAPGTIVPTTQAVVRGQVFSRDGSALPGVTVTVAGHPEFGSTLTQADGQFDMAVNGGGTLRMRYALANFLPAERLVQAPWQDYVMAGDVALTQLDPQVTAVDVSTASATQVVRGSVSSDTSGTRQATVIVPAETTATMTMADGSTQTPTTLNVRATEYTVGTIGPTAMPADLPPTSAYTYAVELSADEALSAGATGVTFSQPLAFYLENFLGFSVGTPVPSGYYDRTKGAWVASANGVVLKVLSVDAGTGVTVDINGDGVADTGSALTAIGITDAELAQVGLLYGAGQTLWRVPISHFSPQDFNWGSGNVDAGPPPGPPAGWTSEGTQSDGPGHCQQSGSIIGCQTQSLGQSVPVAGTPYVLHYESDRQNGRQQSLEIPLSGPSLPGAVERIDLQVDVAGRQFKQSFAPQPNLTTTFVWDGTDAYGRLLQGAQPATIKVGNVYDTSMYAHIDSFGLAPNATLTTSPTRNESTVWATWKSSFDLGPWDDLARGLGGWSFDVNQAYDIGGQRVLIGDGTQQTASDVEPVIQTIAGPGSYPVLGDNGPATSAYLGNGYGLLVGADGSIYIGDASPYGLDCVRRIDPSGIIHTFAGQCSTIQDCPYGTTMGDEGPAISASLCEIQDLAMGPDGSVYIADKAASRIRRVDSNGIIHTVAGTGAYGFSGDGAPATQASLSAPTGIDMAVDGTLYIADRQNYRIRRVGPDGIINTVAGNGSDTMSGLEGMATAAGLGNAVKVRLGPDGSAYILVQGLPADSNAGAVLQVTTDGVIHSFAGRLDGTRCTAYPCGDGGLAAATPLQWLLDLAVARDGAVFIAEGACDIRRVLPDNIITTMAGYAGACNASYSGDNVPASASTVGALSGIGIGLDGSLLLLSQIYMDASNRMLRVHRPLPGLWANANSLQASPDGTQVYVFDSNGRHLETVDAFTNATLYEFSYDSAGHLIAVADVHGDVTQVNRDASGNPTSIVGPFGDVTTVTTDANGYLASVTDPASDTTQFTYSSNGLMASMTDARGGLHQFSYDGAGRLSKDQEPTGGVKTLANTEVDGGFSVVVTTALGTQSTYQTTISPTGTYKRVDTLPSGLQSSLAFATNGTTTVTRPDGTVLTISSAPDPRFGMLAPVNSVTKTLPSGLTSTLGMTRSVTMNGTALSTFTEKLNLSGHTWTRTYNAAAGTWTMTSPFGRRAVTTLDAIGEPLQTAIPNINPISLAYDGHGRVQTVTQGTRQWNFAYDAFGYPDGTTDPLGHLVSSTNDLIGRPILTALADGRLLASSYDGDSNLTSETLPSLAVHAFSYDPIDQLASYSPPSLGTGSWATQYTYDLDGRPSLTTRPDGLTIARAYDSAGRLQTTTCPQGTLTRTYSPTTGHLATLAAPSGETLRYTYDGFLKTGVTWTGPVAGAVTFGFDSSLRLVSRAVNGQALALGYDADSLLTQSGSLTLTRDPQNGRLTGTALGAVTDAYTYDTNGMLLTYVANYNGSPLYTESIVQRDLLGRITQKTETIGTTTHVWGYTYDATGRLTDVTEDGAFASHYGYDADDNRTTFTNTSGSINPTYDAQDRLLAYGATSYTYTANGELASKTDSTGTTTTTYDVFGNLLHVGLSSGTVIDYVVDGENRRVGKKVNATLSTGFLYQDALNMVAQLDGSGNVVATFVFASKPNVPDYFTNSTGTFRILSDHIGSPRLIVNVATGSVAEEIDYDEYGNVTNDSSPGLTPFGFAGGIYDTQTGLVRFGARDFDPHLGRWTAKDPSRFDGGQANFYAYAGNEPINRIDPDGKGFWLALAVEAACEASAAAQLYSTMNGLVDYAGQIAALRKKLQDNEHESTDCPDDQAQQALEAQQINQQIYALSLKQAQGDLASSAAETTFGLETVACTALAAAAVFVPGL